MKGPIYLFIIHSHLRKAIVGVTEMRWKSFIIALFFSINSFWMDGPPREGGEREFSPLSFSSVVFIHIFTLEEVERRLKSFSDLGGLK